MRKSKNNRELGMDREIDRRDFLNGVAFTATAAAAAGLPSTPAIAARQDQPGYYPPILNGMRGSHPGAFETAHSLRDGTFWDSAGKPKDVDQPYDLIIVGGGISGLSAGYFFRAAKPHARILLLDNHDEFGARA